MKPSARTVRVSLAGTRAAVGVVLLAAPVQGVRLVGADSATARRVSWLSRMLAGRDVALAAGALVCEVRGRDSSSWAVAGATADAIDAAALGVAIRQGRLGGARAALAAAASTVAAVAGLGAAAAQLRRRAR